VKILIKSRAANIWRKLNADFTSFIHIFLTLPNKL
jgi:hypothetical protein